VKPAIFVRRLSGESMMKLGLVRIICAALGLAASLPAAAPASAAAIVDAGICDTGCVAVPLNTTIFGHTINAAGIKFTTTEIFNLTSIAGTFSGAGSGTFSIYSLTGGGLPDQEIFSTPVTIPSGSSGFGSYAVSISGVLQPGSWALVATPGPGVATLMTQAGAASAGFTTYPSFAKVDGVWQGLPMSYMGRSVSFALYGDAVPEPATWAMMIVGLGLVGAALRTNGRKVAAQTARV
jgi:hypothetical protein